EIHDPGRCSRSKSPKCDRKRAASVDLREPVVPSSHSDRSMGSAVASGARYAAAHKGTVTAYGAMSSNRRLARKASAGSSALLRREERPILVSNSPPIRLEPTAPPALR